MASEHAVAMIQAAAVDRTIARINHGVTHVL
jgi:hypothetical protein